MKKIIAAFILASLITTPTLASAAKAPPCVVDPPVISLSNPTYTQDGNPYFIVSATGATPLGFYEVTDQQKGHTKTDEDRTWLGQADESGNITANRYYFDARTVAEGAWKPYGVWPGDISIKVIGYHQGGQNTSKGASILATCKATIVE